MSVDTEEEAQRLIVMACARNLDGTYYSRELAQEQNLDLLEQFSQKLECYYEMMMSKSKKLAPKKASKKKAVAVPASKPIVGQCFECDRGLTDDNFCHGCKAFVCARCDVNGLNVAWGGHNKEDHLADPFAEDEEGDDDV